MQHNDGYMQAGYERWMKRFRQVLGWYPDEHFLRSDKSLYALMLKRRSHRDIFRDVDYARLRKFGNIHYIPHDDAYLVIGHDEVDAILQQPERFPRVKSSRLDPDDLIRFSDQEGYDAVMQPLRESMSRSILQADESWLREQAIRSFHELPAGRNFDLYRRFSMPVTWAMTMRLFGFDARSSDLFFLKYGRDLENPRMEAGLHDWFESLCTDGQSGTDGRLLHRLQINIREGRLSVRDAISLLSLMVHAALRTTSVSLSLMIEGLASPGRSRTTGSNIDEKGLPKYMEEIWRLSPPVNRLTRFLMADTELCGVRMLAHTRVILDLRAANRDPGHFTHPSELSPATNRHRHLAFSAGLHQCTGMHVARHQVRVILEALLPLIGGLQCTGTEWMETENGNSSTIAPVRQSFRKATISKNNGNA
jgi:cytochrome P450